MILDPLYRRVPSMLMARRNLSRTRLRSLLAALGIVIGVVAIASLGMAGVALQYSITNQLGDLGNQVQVSPAFDSDVDSVSERDLREIQRVSRGATVTPMNDGYVEVKYGRGDAQMTQVTAVERPADLYQATDGRVPDPLRSGVLIGTTVAERNDVGAGRTITVNGTTMRVRGVIEGKQDSFLLNPANSIVVPESFFRDSGYDSVVVTAQSGYEANQTAQRINGTLNDRRNQFSVTHYGDTVDQVNSVFGIINAFLIGIASISLLVAGISILNVMLMSTVERREEIGVLRAVGFQKRDVLKIMLSESAALGFVGGVVGVLIASVIGIAINHYLVSDPLAFFRLPNFFYLGIAFAFGLGTSVLSGLYPAWKAASEEPVEALRS